MKLLISAIGCDPYGGSEGIYGWYVVSALANRHDVFVITDEANRKNIEHASTRGLVPENLRFRYLGRTLPWHPNRMIARFQSWYRYIKFSKSVLRSARAWHAEIQFDVVQHATFTTWRIASPLWQLGIPFIWGPISGTESFPRSCMGSLSVSARVFERIRSIQTHLALLNPSVRACARAASYIPVPHRQAQEFLRELRGCDKGVELCHNFFFPDSRIAALKSARSADDSSRPLRAFGAGNLEGRKGVAIALEAIALAKMAGVRVEYHVTSSGPELAHLKKLSRKLRLDDQVRLGQRFESIDFASALSTFDICLLPSLRDGAGLSIMEAMLAGCVPIVADWCGPAEFVTDGCGFKIPVTDPEGMALAICNVLLALDKDRKKLDLLGTAASERIKSAYSEEQFLGTMNHLYNSAIRRHFARANCTAQQ